MDEATSGTAPLLAPSAPFAPGASIGRYELAVLVREDDAGSVWLAREKTAPQGTPSERLVALRCLSSKLVGDARFAEILRQEVKLASSVAHPNVAQVLELGEAGGTTFVASEWLDGETLANLRAAAAAKKSSVPTGIVLRVLADVCAGLHAAHLLRDRSGSLLNVVHGDVSPASIVVGTNGAARVIDLGLLKAKARYEGGANLSWLATASKPVPGQRIDRHADVWGIAAILAETAPSLPPPLAEIVTRGRSTDPVERFATAAEMQGAIEAAMMTLGFGTTRASVAAFAKEHLGYRSAARADAVRASREKPPLVLSIPTPAVDSVPATVHTVRPETASTPGAPGSFPEERLVVNTPILATTSSAVARTLTRAAVAPPPHGGKKLALFLTGFAVAVSGAGAAGFLAMRAASHATAAPPATPAAAHAPAATRPSCPSGMLEVTPPIDRDSPVAEPPARFCIDAAPVTTEAYKACSDSGDCKRAATENRWPGISPKEQAAFDPLCHERDPKAHAKEPMNCVDLDMAAVYCAAHDARLPTEAESAFPAHRVDGSEWSLHLHDPPTNRSYAIGFRCARSLEP